MSRLTAAPHVEAVPIATYRWIKRIIEIAPGGADEISRALDAAGTELERLVLRLDLQDTIDLATLGSSQRGA